MPMSEMRDIRELFNVADVAVRLSISRAEVAREIARGRLPSCKLGRRRLVSRAQLAEYIQWLERGGDAA